jgi:mono/diheme cytochrome c family protein
MKNAVSKIMLGSSAAVMMSWTAMADVPAKPTFTKDILPILQENCQTCHRPLGANLSGMVAPMSLMTYQEVRPWAKAMAKAVGDTSMPPWHASEKMHGKFKNERTLTKDEIATIIKWTEMRAPRGNPKDAPEPMTFSETGWNFGEPDLVLSFDEPYWVADEVEDLYHNVTVQMTKEQMPETKWIKSIEFRPGSEVVHHIIGYAAARGDAIDVSGEEGQQTRGMLGGMAPGTEEAHWPEGFGIQIEPESAVTFAMHYHKEAGPGTGKMDSSDIGFVFHDKPIEHPIEISTIAHGTFEIPPGVSDWRVGASRTFHEDTILLSMMPHMHLRGKGATYTAFYPDGTSEELLDVPAYNFNWQTQYDLADNKLLPAGTRIEMELFYDNSAENADGIGFNPNRPVHFGGPTTDEMDLAWITVAPAKPVSGD